MISRDAEPGDSATGDRDLPDAAATSAAVEVTARIASFRNASRGSSQAQHVPHVSLLDTCAVFREIVLQGCRDECQCSLYFQEVSTRRTGRDGRWHPSHKEISTKQIPPFMMHGVPELVANTIGIHVLCNGVLPHIPLVTQERVRDAAQQLGRQRIAMLTGRYPWDEQLDQREALYRDVVRNNGFEPEIVTFSAEGDQRRAAGAALAAHVADHGYPDALSCRKDEILLGAYRTLRHRGCAIPEDIALLGVDGIRGAFRFGNALVAEYGSNGLATSRFSSSWLISDRIAVLTGELDTCPSAWVMFSD